jgi:hypothetical protein
MRTKGDIGWNKSNRIGFEWIDEKILSWMVLMITPKIGLV